MYICHVRFEVFTAVTMKNGVFWVVTPCGSCKNRRFGGVTTQKTPFFCIYAVYLFASWSYSCTLNMEAVSSTETRVTLYQNEQRHFPESNVIYSQYHEDLKPLNCGIYIHKHFLSKFNSIYVY
jgi:hypothetical protein